MGQFAKPTRENRTITVDFHQETTSFALLGNPQAFVEFVLAFILSIGVQLKHQATCRGSGSLTRPAHDARVRLGGLTLWRRQCPTCRAVFTVLPQWGLRYRQMRPEVARHALLAMHGGLRREWCAVSGHIAPRALERMICARGQQRWVAVLSRCELPLPGYLLAEEKHRRRLTDRVSLPTIVSGRVLWPRGYTAEASAVACTHSSGVFQRAAAQQEPTSRVRGILTDGVASTIRSMRTLFPEARLGNCLRHALTKLPQNLAAIPSPVRKALRSQFHPLLSRARQRKGLRGVALGQRGRRFADHVATMAGPANGERVRCWMPEKKAGWDAVLADPQMPETSPCLDQAHTAIEREWFAMTGVHQPGGNPQAFVTGLAHRYNLGPYQRRAQHVGQGGVEVEGGR